MLFSSVTAILAAVVAMPVVSAIPTISAVGSKFFTSDGDQFYVKGIAYQLSESDPLVDGTQCQNDVKLMSTLGANAIRVYHVDPEEDHDACMQAFSDAGIYAFIDLDTFSTYILGNGTYWNSTQFNAYSKVLDTFQKYDNVAGFFVGNEVLSIPQQSPAAAYVKAAARDLKAYRDSKNYRDIPIGYSAADIAELRPMLQNYLVCGDNASDSIDFFSLNAYEWCQPTDDYHTSGYATLQAQAEGYPVPIFFSETGCNTAPPRLFADQAAIFGPDMRDTWSGAIVYEWIQESNTYGLIAYPGNVINTADPAQDTIVRSGVPTPVTPDFANLQSVWKNIVPSGVALSDYSQSVSGLSTPACPASTPGASGWEINGNPALPTQGQSASFNPTGPSTTVAPTGSPTGTASAASGTATQGAASGGKEVAGMAVGLGAVMLGFVVWL